MDKKLPIIGVVVALVAVISGSVSGGLYTDSKDFGLLINNNTRPGPDFTYSYDVSWLTDNSNYQITGADLTLEFTDDEPDGTQLKTQEVVDVYLPRSTDLWHAFGEVGTNLQPSVTYTGPLSVSWLTDDSILDVWIDISNDGPDTDVYLTRSTLNVYYDIVPVPLPASILLGVFAVGLAGRKLRKFV